MTLAVLDCNFPDIDAREEYMVTGVFDGLPSLARQLRVVGRPPDQDVRIE